MDVSVNGEMVSVDENAVLSDVIRNLQLSPEQSGTAVAVNDEVIPKGRWGSLRIQMGDRIEIVRPVQGG
ncbi:MAG: sulfur carrier protein ThiS [Nitrospirae bacterium]|nr:sulfur carrier protein ThiS [Nitrospirota bacterium]